MKKNFLLLIFYLITFLTFLLSINIYIPRPKLKSITPNFKNNKYIYFKTNFDNKLSNKAKREIAIGNSYVIFWKKNLSFNLTPISFLDKQDFKLSYFVGYLPELFIDADQINTMKIGNYGLNKSNNKYQSCLFDFENPLFLYEFGDLNTIYRYSDYKHWLSIAKKEIWSLLKNERKENSNCFLITTDYPEIFEKEKEIIKLISNKFVFE